MLSLSQSVVDDDFVRFNTDYEIETAEQGRSKCPLFIFRLSVAHVITLWRHHLATLSTNYPAKSVLVSECAFYTPPFRAIVER